MSKQISSVPDFLVCVSVEMEYEMNYWNCTVDSLFRWVPVFNSVISLFGIKLQEHIIASAKVLW